MKPTRIPRRIRVGQLRYRVYVDDSAHRWAEWYERDRLNGHCHYDELRITLRPDLPRAKQREVLFHEALHAVCELVGINHDLRNRTRIDEEQLVRRLAPALVALLRDNPKLTTYLTAEDPS